MLVHSTGLYMDQVNLIKIYNCDDTRLTNFAYPSPRGFEEGDDCDEPKILLLYQGGESTKQNDGGPSERQAPETADRLVDERPPQYDAIQPCFWQPAFFRHNHGCHAGS